MKKILFLLLVSSFQVIAKLPVLNAFVELPHLNIQAEINKDLTNNNKARPLRYASVAHVENVSIKHNQSQGGQWNQLSNGSWVWRLNILAESALSLDVSLDDFFLPPGAELRIYDWSGNLAKGPYTDKNNTSYKQLWPGPIIGHEITLELVVSDKYKKYVSFSVNKVFRGFRRIWQEVDVIAKTAQLPFWNSVDNRNTNNSSSCNVDVACEDANNWQDQVNSVARYTFHKEGSLFTCTGQLLNNSNNDRKPLFLSAFHCGLSENLSTNYWQSIAQSINIWWNYQSNTCRLPNTSSNSTPIAIENFNDTQSGARVLAQYQPSDMVLLELNETPDESYDVYYSGWDRSDTASSSGVVIHHPNFNAKRISFEYDSLSITSYTTNSTGDKTHLRVNDWDKGTTEPGSSGAGLWNDEKLLVGQLHGGYAACGNDEPDWFGRLFTSWDGGGNSDSSLKKWLDPVNTNTLKLQGLNSNQCQSFSVSIDHQADQEIIGEEQIYSASVSGGLAPYTYQWDINGDEAIDGNEAQITVKYANKFIDNVRLTVTDSNGCLSNISKAVIIESPQINIKSVESAQQVCGNNDNYVDPGERWRVPVVLQNNGQTTANNSYAVLTKLNSVNGIDAFSGYVYLETPALSLGTMQESQQKTRFLEYSISQDAPCDNPVTIQMEAAVYESGFNQESNSIVSTTLGNNGSCHVSYNCQVSDENTIVPTSGLWDNPQRSGNGLDMYFLSEGNEIDSLIYLQYTAKKDRSPIWYITGSYQQMQNNQSTNEILQVTYNGPFSTSERTDSKVGQSTTTLIDSSHAIQTRTINNQFSAELLEPLNFGGSPTEQRTGIWHNSAEDGWGLSIGTKGNNEVILSYLYDSTGQPYWLLGSGENSTVDFIDMSYYKTFCPHCPKTSVEIDTVGNIQVEYNKYNVTGKINALNIDFINNKHNSNWNRNNLPIELITPALD